MRVLRDALNIAPGGPSGAGFPSGGGTNPEVDLLTAQVAKLAAMVEQMSGRDGITVVTGAQATRVRTEMTALLVLLTTVTAYAYVQGYGWTDFAWVTKSAFRKSLKGVITGLSTLNDAVARVRRQLQEQIEGLQERVEQGLKVQEEMKDQVDHIAEDIGRVGHDVEDVQQLVLGVEERLRSVVGKQDQANQGIHLLCSLVAHMFMNRGGQMTPQQVRLLQHMQSYVERLPQAQEAPQAQIEQEVPPPIVHRKPQRGERPHAGDVDLLGLPAAGAQELPAAGQAPAPAWPTGHAETKQDAPFEAERPATVEDAPAAEPMHEEHKQVATQEFLVGLQGLLVDAMGSWQGSDADQQAQVLSALAGASEASKAVGGPQRRRHNEPELATPAARAAGSAPDEEMDQELKKLLESIAGA